MGRTMQVENRLPGPRLANSVAAVSTALLVVVIRFRWVSMTPLGRPVVPPVYMRMARSCSSTGEAGTGSVSGAILTSSS